MGGLATEIESAISARPDFESTRGNGIRRTSRIWGNNAVVSVLELRDTPKRDRDPRVDDMRGNEYAYIQTRVTPRLSDVFGATPNIATGRRSIEI